MLFCSLKDGIRACFVIINTVLFDLSCVWIFPVGEGLNRRLFLMRLLFLLHTYSVSNFSSVKTLSVGPELDSYVAETILVIIKTTEQRERNAK